MDRQRQVEEGLIPARAGSTTPTTSCRPPQRAHPRSRGEHDVRQSSFAFVPGSSPLARGALAQGARRVRVSGLIPARAGSTRPPSHRPARTRAHPRSRGEHTYDPVADEDRVGSSPLARGAHRRRHGPALRGGLIPARARSTPGAASATAAARAHPRWRGEHDPARHGVACDRGSSPLARGARRRHARGPQGPGLIPARAGSTAGCTSGGGVARAHPRSRGEHVRRVTRTTRSRGSSPLARGALGGLGIGRGAHGLIPARAGSTRPRRRSSCAGRAHPRSRGEHVLVGTRTAATLGSSPLARGARLQLGARDVDEGLIPARAGSTPPARRPARRRSADPRSRGEHPRGTLETARPDG